MSRRSRQAFLSLVFALAASCGGGGGGGGGGGNPGSQVPVAPANLVVTPANSDLILTWTASPGATSYNVYAGLAAGVVKDPTSLMANVAGSPTTVGGVTAGTKIYFAVAAVNVHGESALSNEAAGTGGGGPPPTGDDPLYVDQWHLKNTGQKGGTPGEDVNVAPVWAQNVTGANVRIAVVDDGLEIAHEDLALNIAAGLSHNYVTGGVDPTGGQHGTCCAGVAAALGKNGKGGTGVAFNASMVGFNILQNLTETNVIDAMTRNANSVWISTNSWGATDGLGVPQPSAATWQQAVLTGLQQGRNGKGTVYLWAAGNGATTQQGLTDDSNLDGQANFPGVIAIGAVGDDGKKAFYSENGANVWVATPSMGRANHAITTVDRTGALGYNQGGSATDYANVAYTNTFNGTSSATPLAAGIVALMLEANLELGWRDVRLILAETARKNDPTDADWTQNAAGYHINHKYGFGVIDAQAAVARAKTWTNVGALTIVDTPVSTPDLAIPDADPTGVSDAIVVAGSGIQSLEYVRVMFNSDDHTWGADLEVVLTAPSGTESVLAQMHNAPHNAEPYVDWIFGDVRHLGEPADGSWTLTVRDLAQQDVGTFKTWSLELLGR